MHIDFVIPVNGRLSKGYEVYAEIAKKESGIEGMFQALVKFGVETPLEQAFLRGLVLDKKRGNILKVLRLSAATQVCYL
ncbi:hypothetical protein L1987_87945 [Smallanthus sonchifolius]|nr:hypothetical protein L1987_87945 [Smallanthus sonchifolius]